MARGDHLERQIMGNIHHHGIDVGDGTVIDFASADGAGTIKSKVNNTIRQVSFETFADGKPVYIIQHDPVKCFLPEEVVQRAKSKLGQRGYDLFKNNCEHFANWCKTGHFYSQQAVDGERKVRYGAVAAGATTANVATSVAIPTLMPMAITTVANVAAATVLGPISIVVGGLGYFLFSRKRRRG